MNINRVIARLKDISAPSTKREEQQRKKDIETQKQMIIALTLVLKQVAKEIGGNFFFTAKEHLDKGYDLKKLEIWNKPKNIGLIFTFYYLPNLVFNYATPWPSFTAAVKQGESPHVTYYKTTDLFDHKLLRTVRSIKNMKKVIKDTIVELELHRNEPVDIGHD